MSTTQSQALHRRVLYLSHGGGPLPLLGDSRHLEMVQCLQQLAAEIGKPTAVLLISAHWEQATPTITAASAPELIYDYYGFPPESYQISYPAPGQPELAGAVFNCLNSAGFNPHMDTARGFDHGLFVPMKIMYPEADIPCVQLSLLHNLNAAQHIEMGKALAALEQHNLLIIGSGFSFHNMRAFFNPDTPEQVQMNQVFDNWLYQTCCDADLSEQQRNDRLANWQQAPNAHYCHPREEHLLPLHVCYGVTQRPCNHVFQLKIMGKQASMYLW